MRQRERYMYPRNSMTTLTLILKTAPEGTLLYVPLRHLEELSFVCVWVIANNLLTTTQMLTMC